MRYMMKKNQILGSSGQSPTNPQKTETSNEGLNKKDIVKNMISMATSGNVFTGDRIRRFPMDKIRYKGKLAPNYDSNEHKPSASTLKKNSRLDCKKWAVVTTIFSPPSEAVRRLLYRKEWCIVVVGDRYKPGEVPI